MKVRIFDNGGKTIDRYTVIFDSVNDCYHLSHDANSPIGVAMWDSDYSPNFNEKKDRELYGKEIKIDDLPSGARAFVEKKIKQLQLEDVYEILAGTEFVNPAEYRDEHHIQIDYTTNEINITNEISGEKFTLIVK